MRLRSFSFHVVGAGLLSAWLLFSPGCATTRPTYLPLTANQLATAAAQLGTDTQTALAEQRAALRSQLSETLGMQVDAIFAENDGTYTAQIEPAADEALRKGLAGPIKHPTEPERWLSGGIAGLTVLIMALFGARGAQKRRKANVA